MGCELLKLYNNQNKMDLDSLTSEIVRSKYKAGNVFGTWVKNWGSLIFFKEQKILTKVFSESSVILINKKSI